MGAPQRLLPPLLLARFALMALARRPTNATPFSRAVARTPISPAHCNVRITMGSAPIAAMTCASCCTTRAFTLRCEQAGLSLQPTALDGAQTAFTTVRDYSTRTFSRADAAEPSEPLHIRALCCPRLAGPAMGFLELPGRAMRWAPLPHRGTYDISSWTPMWMCMRCQRELPTARVQVPHPRPNCPNCCVPFAWEGDIRHAVERWVCSRCLVAGPAHPLALQQLACSPNTSDADRIGHVDSIGGPCAVSVPDASLPATPPHAPSTPLMGCLCPAPRCPKQKLLTNFVARHRVMRSQRMLLYVMCWRRLPAIGFMPSRRRSRCPRPPTPVCICPCC